MSVLSRLRSLLGGAPEPAVAPPAASGTAPDRESTGSPSHERDLAPAEPTPLEELALLGASPDADADVDRRAVRLLLQALSTSAEAAVLEAARTITARRQVPELRTRLADRLLSRGDTDGAQAVLEPLVPPSSDHGPLEAWMIAAEIAERRGDPACALGLYERVVARDYAYPRARERALRLREAHAMPRKLEGATLLGEGASTRRFRILAELGRGGAGTVFLAEEPALARTVALKIYHRRGRADRERMLHEARMAASLEHPGVVRVLDLDDTLGAIAMEPLEDGSVKSRLSRGDVDGALALGWARSTAHALAFVHSRGIVHGDLKPSNFLLRGAGSVVLTDFGIARTVGEAPREVGEGSLGYMPPEQQAGAAATFAMDVYALGVSLREMLGDGQHEPAVAAIAGACASPRIAERPSLQALRDALG